MAEELLTKAVLIPSACPSHDISDSWPLTENGRQFARGIQAPVMMPIGTDCSVSMGLNRYQLQSKRMQKNPVYQISRAMYLGLFPLFPVPATLQQKTLPATGTPSQDSRSIDMCKPATTCTWHCFSNCCSDWHSAGANVRKHNSLGYKSIAMG